MLREKNKAVPESNSPICQDVYVMLNGITLEDLHRIMSEAADKVFDKHFEQTPENPEDMRAAEQHSGNLEQEAREPCTKTHERAEGAAAAERATSGFDDNFTGLPARPCSRGDALVDNYAAAPKP